MNVVLNICIYASTTAIHAFPLQFAFRNRTSTFNLAPKNVPRTFRSNTWLLHLHFWKRSAVQVCINHSRKHKRVAQMISKEVTDELQALSRLAGPTIVTSVLGMLMQVKCPSLLHTGDTNTVS